MAELPQGFTFIDDPAVTGQVETSRNISEGLVLGPQPEAAPTPMPVNGGAAEFREAGPAPSATLPEGFQFVDEPAGTSFLEEISNAVTKGAFDTADMYARAGRVLGFDTTEAIEALKGRAAPYQPTRDDYISGSILGGISSTIQSIGGGIPGALIGAFGGPAGAVGGFAAGAGTLFSLAEYDRFLEDAEAQGISRDAIGIKKAALISAIAEGGMEAVQTLVGAKIFGLASKNLIAEPVKRTLLQSLGRLGKRTAQLAAVEVPGESITSVIQAGQRRKVGLLAPSPLEAAVEPIGTATVQSLIMGPLAGGVRRLRQGARPQVTPREQRETALRDAITAGPGPERAENLAFVLFPLQAGPGPAPPSPDIPLGAPEGFVPPERPPVAPRPAEEVAEKVEPIDEIEKYPIAKDTVDGREVLEDIPNTASIESSLTDYDVLESIREIPMAGFESKLTDLFYAADDMKKARDLAEKIKESGQISPLIVVEDKEGLYILEGAHRMGALNLIGAKSFPALVVRDLTEPAPVAEEVEEEIDEDEVSDSARGGAEGTLIGVAQSGEEIFYDEDEGSRFYWDEGNRRLADSEELGEMIDNDDMSDYFTESEIKKIRDTKTDEDLETAKQEIITGIPAPVAEEKPVEVEGELFDRDKAGDILVYQGRIEGQPVKSGFFTFDKKRAEGFAKAKTKEGKPIVDTYRAKDFPESTFIPEGQEFPVSIEEYAALHQDLGYIKPEEPGEGVVSPGERAGPTKEVTPPKEPLPPKIAEPTKDLEVPEGEAYTIKPPELTPGEISSLAKDVDTGFAGEAIKGLKAKGKKFIDAYHVSDIERKDEISKEGIKRGDPWYQREGSVYFFADPDDIKLAIPFLAMKVEGVKGGDVLVTHFQIPVDDIKKMHWDGFFNVSFETYSAFRINKDISKNKINEFKLFKIPSVEDFKAQRRGEPTTAKKITDILKNEKGGIDLVGLGVYDDLVSVGRDVIGQGHTRFSAFQKRMKEIFGEVWDKIRRFMRGIFADAKRKATEVRGDIEILRPKEEKVPTVAEPGRTFEETTPSKEDVPPVKDGQSVDEVTEIPPSFQDTLGETTEADFVENRKETRNVLLAAKRGVKRVAAEIAEGIDQFTGAISTRLGNVSLKLKAKLRKLDFDTNTKYAADVKRVEPMLRKAQSMTKDDAADFDYARKNSTIWKINELIVKYDMQKEWDVYRQTLDGIRKEGVDVGLRIGIIEEYSPRMLKDSRGFLTAIGKDAERPEITNMLKRRAEAMGINLERMNPDMKAELVSNMILGGWTGLGGVSATKPRVLKKIPAHLNKYYAHSDTALVQHLYEMRKTIEARKFFGKIPQKVVKIRKSLFTAQAKIRELNKKLDTDLPEEEHNKVRKLRNKYIGTEKQLLAYLNEYAAQRDYRENIAAYIIELIDRKEISPRHERVVNDILTARFHEVGTRGLVQAYKNISYIDTMGSPISALTQIGDLAWAAYEGGFVRAFKFGFKALMNKSRITKEDVGVSRIAQEFADPGTLGNMVSKVFKIVGLEKIDSIGKESLLNSALDVFQKQAKNNPAKLKKQIRPIFELETDSVIDDLVNDEISENVKLLVYNRLLDFQPVALSEMPQKYLDAGNGRLFYMLKTFTLKVFDVFRNESYNKIKNGNRSEKIQGMKNLVMLSMMFVLANAGADELKDWVLGRKTDFEDRVVDNMLRLFGVSKFVTWKARTEGVGSALARQILPPFKFVDSVGKDIIHAGDGKGLETLASVPILGKLAYWHIGRGTSKREDLWDRRLRKEKAKLNKVKDRFDKSKNKSQFSKDHRESLLKLRRLNRFQGVLNRYRKRINRLKSLGETRPRKKMIQQLEEKRTSLIRAYLSRKETLR